MLTADKHNIEIININHINQAYGTDFNNITGYINGFNFITYKLDDKFLLRINKKTSHHNFIKLNQVIKQFH